MTLGLAIAFGTLYYTLRNVSLQELAASFDTVEVFYLIPSAAIIFLSYVVHALRWQVLLLPIRRVNASSLFSPIMVGAMGNILPGRPGEIFRAYLLGKKLDIPVAGALATILIERVFDLVILLILFTWILLFHAEIFSSRIVHSGVPVQELAVGFGKITGALLGVLIVFVYLAVFHKEIVRRWVEKCTRPLPARWHGKIAGGIDEFSRGLNSIQDFSSLVKVSLYSVVECGANIFAFYPLYWAYQLQDKSVASVLILMVVVAIFVVVLPTPAFLGSFNAGVVVALHEMMGEAELAAVSFGMVSWALNFLVIFLSALYFIFHDHLSTAQLMRLGKQDAVEYEKAE